MMQQKSATVAPGPGRRRARKLPHYLTAAQVEQLLAASVEANERLLILLCWRAGLRVTEALGVEARDLELGGDPTVRIRAEYAKNNRERIVPLHPELAMALKYAVEYAGKHSLVGMNRTTAWRRVKRCAERSGLDTTELGVHTLRHSAARHRLSEGIEINRVQLWLGHSDLRTTPIYLALTPDAAGDMQRLS